MAIKKAVTAILSEINTQIDIGDDDIVTIFKSINAIHLFDDVIDFRQVNKIKYKLNDLLLLAMLVILETKSQSFMYIAKYIEVNHSKYENLGLIKDNDYPSHDTFRRVFSLLDSSSFKEATILRLYEFLKEIEIAQKGLAHLAIDGKTVNGTGRSKDTKKPHRNYNVLNVYSSTLGTCLYSEVIDDKTNEIPVSQDILSIMDLSKVVVTADAIHCQKETCKVIKEKKGHYLLTVRENQKNLYEEVIAKFNNKRYKPTLIHQDESSIKIIRLPSNYEYDGFESIRSFVMLISHKRKNECIRYFVTDLVKQDEIQMAVNSRWSIENFHNIKDVYLNEDKFRCTDKKAVKNIVQMNNLITQLLKIYLPLSGYDNYTGKIALRSRPFQEIAKLLSIISSKEIKDKMLNAIK